MSEKKEMTGYPSLSTQEATKRLQEHGLNAVEEEKKNPVGEFLARFWGPIPWMLEVAAVLEVAVGKYAEAAVILALLVFNSVMAFLHEGKAQKALELLKQRLAVKARVMRDGKWAMLDAKYLVPDDLIHLRMGDFVPADVQILDSQIQLDQSALTGESLPVEAEIGSVAYSGSIVKRGEASGVVVATGKNSYFGKTAELVKIAKTKSNLSTLIFRIVKYLLYLDIALAAVFMGYVALVDLNVLPGGPISIISAIVFVLVILIAAIPIALPATYTLSTALGALQLSKLGVLTTKLSAIEESAAMTVLCSDKTGTLTENKVVLEDVTPVEGVSRDQLLQYGEMASDRRSQDALDDAIFKVADAAGVQEAGDRQSFTPFDPATKRTEAAYNLDGQDVRVYKGQPRTIWELTRQGDAAAYPHEETEKQLASKGERVLAVAIKQGGNFSFLGFLGFMDPERADSKPLVEELRSLGIRVIMLTGDTAITARTIAKRLGIGERVCERTELLELSKTTEGQKKLIDYDAFGGIYPEDKYNIVRALQGGGYIAGMTGDGVNDSPALKAAEVGIAVAGATDVAKAAASVVLTEPGLGDIVSAIKTSREIFQRMATWILNKIAKTIEISFFTILGVIFTKSFIITPMLVILLLFTNDFVTMSISTDNVKYSKDPNNWNVKNMLMGAVPMGMFQLLFSFGALIYLEKINPLPLGQIQTIVFLIMVFTGLGMLYLVRTGGPVYSTKPSKYMLMATIGDVAVVSLMATFGILMPSIPFTYVAYLLGITVVYLFLVDLIKIPLFRKYAVRP